MGSRPGVLTCPELEVIRDLFDGLDDLLAIHSTCNDSERSISVEMVTSWVKHIANIIPGMECKILSRERLRIVRQMMESRSKLSKANLDTTVMDHLVGSVMGVLNAKLSKLANKARVCTLWLHDPLIPS